MGQEDGPKKIVIIVVSSLLLVALVAVIVYVCEDAGSKKQNVKTSASQKAITAICQTTDYQDTCFSSLNGHNSSDPKELIQAAMQATIAYINSALRNSTVLRQSHTTPRAKSALDTCGQLGNRAVGDLQRSFSKFKQFDITNVDDILLELKMWISAAMTHQETCLDGFEKVPGDDGARMKDFLTTSMQMTSNALAMVAEISTFLESMGVQGHRQTSRRRLRRLLSQDLVEAGSGSWVDADKRRLIAVQPMKIRPNIIVAKDGSGMFRTINEALPHIPKNSNKTFVLYIKQGVYQEQVRINTSYTNVLMIGDGPTKTRITGKLNFVDGALTYNSATVAVHGDDFIARDIGFENTAGAAKLQAVALLASSDKSIFFNCHIEAYQSTLYTHAYRQFYKDCLISGTVDFIFGDSAAVFQDCSLLFRKPLDNQQNTATAQGRIDVRQPTALVLQNCSFAAHPELEPVKHKIKSYLGRPWKEYSRTIIMESYLEELIHPDGWTPWQGDFALQTLFYTEFNNRGMAAAKAQRVKWPGVKELPPDRIKRFTAAELLDGNRWIMRQRVPYAAGFIFPAPKEDPNIKYSPISTEETKDLGSAAERKKKTDSNNSNNKTETPPATSPLQPVPRPATAPTATPPASAPQSAVGTPAALSPVVAVSPTAASAVANAPAPLDNSGMEAGELIIDLSPAPVPAPTSDMTEAPALSPSGSPVTTPQPGPAASPSTTPALSPTAGSPATSPVSGGSTSEAPASSPQSSSATLSPNGSPTSAPPPNAGAASSPSGGPAAAPQSTLAPQTAQAPSLTGAV